VVEAATEEYRHESDPLAEFIDGKCEVGSALTVGASTLYGVYCNWRSAAGGTPESQWWFGQQIRQRFSVDDRNYSMGTVYRGIGLRPGRQA
jgi:phage/plasmid-associated DNA primase